MTKPKTPFGSGWQQLPSLTREQVPDGVRFSSGSLTFKHTSGISAISSVDPRADGPFYHLSVSFKGAAPGDEHVAKTLADFRMSRHEDNAGAGVNARHFWEPVPVAAKPTNQDPTFYLGEPGAPRHAELDAFGRGLLKRGWPVFEVSVDLFESLRDTEVSPEPDPLPFRDFVVQVGNDRVICFSRDAAKEALVEETPDGQFMVVVLANGECQDSTHAIVQFVANLATYICHCVGQARLDEEVASIASVNRKRAAKNKRALPPVIRLELAVSIPTGRTRNGGKVEVRHLVRGHWRNQAVGPGRTARRKKWIRPHWRGPKDGRRTERRYEVAP